MLELLDSMVDLCADVAVRTEFGAWVTSVCYEHNIMHPGLMRCTMVMPIALTPNPTSLRTDCGLTLTVTYTSS